MVLKNKFGKNILMITMVYVYVVKQHKFHSIIVNLDIYQLNLKEDKLILII